MAVGLLNYTVADLCLGKPPLRRISAVSATVSDALESLKLSSSDDPFVSLWDCNCFDTISQESVKDRHNHSNCRQSICVGRVCIADIICYLCNEVETSISSKPSSALKAPATVLLREESKDLVKHVEPSSSLIEAIDLILDGAQHLIVPIKNHRPSRRKHQEYFCWLTQEDLIRFLLSSIGLFSPIPTLSIEALNIITTHEVPTLRYDSPARSAIGSLHHTSIAVVDNRGALIGEISPLAISCYDETAVAAILTLSAGEMMAYVDAGGGGPPEDLLTVVEERLRKEKLSGVLEEFETSFCRSAVGGFMSLSSSASSSSSDDESYFPWSHGRTVRRVEAIVCHRWSSLVAVMVQAIAHRVSYVWVVEEDCALVGVVNFVSILRVFRESLEARV